MIPSVREVVTKRVAIKGPFCCAALVPLNFFLPSFSPMAELHLRRCSGSLDYGEGVRVAGQRHPATSFKRRLKPVFETRIHRTSITVRKNRSHIEAREAID